MTTEEPVVPIEGVAEPVGDEHAVGENPPAETAKSKKATTKKESKPKKAAAALRKRNPPYLEVFDCSFYTSIFVFWILHLSIFGEFCV